MLHQVLQAQQSTHQLEPFEVGMVQWLRRPEESAEELLPCGLWTVTPDDAPETFEIEAPGGETIYIVSGHIRIEIIGGETLDMTQGTMASIAKGTRSRWTVLEPTVEFFVYS